MRAGIGRLALGLVVALTIGVLPIVALSNRLPAEGPSAAGARPASPGPKKTPRPTSVATPTPAPTATASPAPSTPTPLPPSPTPAAQATAPPAPVTLVGAGDIASCSSTGDEATAALLLGIPGTVFTLGDNVYDNGTATEYASCYGPSWGQASIKSRTKPVPGNHEYNTANATGYYGYFGAAAGDPTKGYYAYDAGAWRVYVLNSNCAAIGGCSAGSLQEQWLRADLAANPRTCVLAMWHHPLFSSGEHGNGAATQALFQALYDMNADLVLVGHDHDYERFAPQTATGTPDNARGIVQVVVGTGGRSHYAFGTIRANSIVRNGDTYGVLRLSLAAAGWSFSFVPEAGRSFADSGTGTCH